MRDANTRQLTRIIMYLKDIEIMVNISKIAEDTGLRNVKDGITWLVSNGIVVKYMSINGVFLYQLNPKWTRWEKEK